MYELEYYVENSIAANAISHLRFVMAAAGREQCRLAVDRGDSWVRRSRGEVPLLQRPLVKISSPACGVAYSPFIAGPRCGGPREVTRPIAGNKGGAMTRRRAPSWACGEAIEGEGAITLQRRLCKIMRRREEVAKTTTSSSTNSYVDLY